MMHRLRNLNVYPSLFFLDQISSQLRIIRPVAWNKTEINSQCLGVVRRVRRRSGKPHSSVRRLLQRVRHGHPR